ncbi:MAG: prepilin-type N-terminal cleavage/methylation domain-containing protein [Vibrio sp.]
MTSSLSAKHKGFSLLETLISMLILTVGIVGLIQLQAYMDKQADFAENSIRALHLAESKLELFRLKAITEVGQGDNFTFIQNGQEQVAHFTLQWRVTEVLPDQLKAIDIETRWNNQLNEEESLRLKTMIFIPNKPKD